MSEKNSQLNVCDDHPGVTAQAICKYHRKLLCIDCAFEKAKSSECSITLTKNISNEQDHALYEGLLVNQTANNKKCLIETHEYKTKALENDLKKQITDFHEQLISNLNKTKEDLLSLTEKAADAIIAENRDDKQRLETFEKAIAESLETLCSGSSFDVTGIKTKLHEVKKQLNDIPDLNSNPEGKFEADKSLKDILSEPELTLGKVLMIFHTCNHYTEVENETDNNSEIESQAVSDKDINTDSQSQTRSVVEPTEEDIIVRETKPEKGKQTMEKTAEMIESSQTHQDNGDKKQEQRPCGKEEDKHDRKSQDIKGVKGKSGILRLFRKKASDSEKQDKDTKLKAARKERSSFSGKQTPTEVVYQVTFLEKVQCNHPKELINKTATINGIKNHFKSACEFSKIVPLESNCLMLLSRTHDSVVLASIDGNFYEKKTLAGFSDIVALGREEMAAIKLVDKNLQIVKYWVNNKKFKLLGNFIVNADVPKITGFDFDIASSKFAVSSPGKLVIFKHEKTERETSYPIGSTTNTGEVVTIYDFSDDCIYLLDSQNTTLKCYSCPEASYLWKIRIDGSHTPRKMCLYENKLCLTYGNAIGIFNAKDGKTDVRHDTSDLLDDCYGLCVIDGVIMFSSSSSDFDTSTELAFISI